ncbi:hypothetical protein ACP70R_047983 [Stipagrostis hirtigluma subsp. patula]
MDAGLHEELPDWMSQLSNKLFGFEKLDLEANRDDSMCTMKVAQGETHPLVEGMLDIESNEDDTLSSMDEYGGRGGRPDEEFYPIINKEAEYYKSMKRVSKKTIENGLKWMTEECFLAFTKSAEKIHFECHCYGCKSQDAYDLKHPISGGYEEGHADICWPFENGTC